MKTSDVIRSRTKHSDQFLHGGGSYEANATKICNEGFYIWALVKARRCLIKKVELENPRISQNFQADILVSDSDVVAMSGIE